MLHVVCLLGLKVFAGQKENPCREPSIKSLNSSFMSFSVGSTSSTVQDILLQKPTELKRRVERVLRKGNRVSSHVTEQT